MPVIGLDDTDSREQGMCTTYLAARVAESITAAGGAVDRRLLVRLNPAVKYKTRGNAALALHASAISAADAFAIAGETLERFAVGTDPRTSPGVVVADAAPDSIPDGVADFARAAVRELHALDDAVARCERHGFSHRGWTGGDGSVAGRGRIGALAAVGAWRAFDDWTAERISYREFDRCGTPREVDFDSVFAAADRGYPAVWDTVDRIENQAVCVPNAPGPILHGIRGDDPDTCRAVAARIESESVDRAATFLTNQGTDAHLADGSIGDLRDDAGYRVDGVVASEPETRRGGHVFFDLAAADRDDAAADAPAVRCAAFEPTKRFRDRVRALRPGDRLTACGEHAAGTLKLEKFAVRDLNRIERVTPPCPDCRRRMKSAGRDQGYRCRGCGTTAPGKVTRELDRDLELGWYEVPPCARRHIAKPLVRGGFDAPVHPER
ncbi:TiaS agmantine-binding domain-containing protein [Haloferacaceae archaeon DSL9]